MPIYNLFETIHNTWLQQFDKKSKELFNAIVDDSIRALGTSRKIQFLYLS